MSDRTKQWIEVDPIYLTDFKKRPIEVFIFFNRCTYKADLKTPMLRRKPSYQTISVDKKSEIESAVVGFVTRPNTRLLAEGLSANDWKRLPHEVRNPAKEIINGTAAIYENV